MAKSRLINKCIYCGYSGTELSNEHIIPYGLNGEWTLLKASCINCANITSLIEMFALRNIFGSARASYKLKTRRVHPDSYTLSGKKDGNDINIEVSTEKYGAVITLLGYQLPAYLEKRPYEHGISINESYLIRSNGRDLKELAQELGLQTISFTQTFKGNEFEKFIAKIAYCFTVFQYGLDKLKDIYILPAILGTKDDIGMWLGSYPPSLGEVDNEVKLNIINNEVHAHIRLFGKLPVPTYVVVVGKLTE